MFIDRCTTKSRRRSEGRGGIIEEYPSSSVPPLRMAPEVGLASSAIDITPPTGVKAGLGVNDVMALIN